MRVRALVLHDTTGPDALRLEDFPAPAPAEGLVEIEVHAAGIGFVDWLVTRGEYQIRPPLPFVPGIEVAGVAEGRRVAASVPFGAFAETAVAPAIVAFEMPDAMTFVQGAAMVTNYQTAHLALLRRGRLAVGESVLVLGAAGGVGLATIQVAKAAGAGRVIAIVSTAERGEQAVAAGADVALLVDSEWEKAERADIVVDPVGGDAFRRALRCLNPEGRVLVVGFASGAIPQLEVNRLLLRHADVVGVNYGGMLMVDQDFAQAAWADLRRWFDAGMVTPAGITEHALADIPGVLRDLGERRASGKPVAVVR
jgi:NADPH2:quinone reductase